MKIVEHLDTGLLTLHEDRCRHLAHAVTIHTPTPALLAQIDKACGHCRPPQSSEGVEVEEGGAGT